MRCWKAGLKHLTWRLGEALRKMGSHSRERYWAFVGYGESCCLLSGLLPIAARSTDPE